MCNVDGNERYFCSFLLVALLPHLLSAAFWMKRGWAGSDVLDKDGHALCILFIHCCLLSYIPSFRPPLPPSHSLTPPPAALLIVWIVPAELAMRDQS